MLFGIGRSKNLLGLDLGSSSIKVVELKDLGKGKGYHLKAFGMEPLPAEAIVGGTIMDSGAVIDGIQKVLRDNNIKNTNVAVSIDGSAVIIKRITLTAMSEAEISEAINWEAQQYIPFDIEEVKIDYHVLDIDPGGSVNVLLVALRRDVLNDMTSIMGQAGVIPTVLDVDSFCLQNSYEINYPISGSEVTALVNIGAGITNISILKGANPLFWRDIQVGGKNYTDALQRELNLSYVNAEELKKGSAVEGVPFEKAVPVINSVTEEVGNELKKTVDFFKVTTNENAIHKIILAGGGTKIINLDKYISQIFGIPVEIMNPFRNIQIDDKTFDIDLINRVAPSCAVAVGLALRKMGD